jgi:hypothetical protein
MMSVTARDHDAPILLASSRRGLHPGAAPASIFSVELPISAT